jgi:mono/diheme cytochrome c family protein
MLWLGGILIAQAPAGQPASSVPVLKLDTGKAIFEAACIGCHGPGGEGQPLSILGFEPPASFPDFTDCNGSSREKVFDWRAVIHEGGPGRGFSDMMPSFAEALTLDQIDLVRAYLRELCTDPDWPLGELNLPRPLFTEKAFPEDEWVLAGAADATGDGAVSNRIIYEKRFGVRNQLEIIVPFSFTQQGRRPAAGRRGSAISSSATSARSSAACRPVPYSASRASWPFRRETRTAVSAPA